MTSFFKNKKGQFYIFIAILLITYAFNIARPVPFAQEKPDVFRELYKNFITESSVVVNNALYENKNVSGKFLEFSNGYADYARTRSSQFRFAYVLKEKDMLVVGNKLGISINLSLTNASYNVTDSSTKTIRSQDITLAVAGVNYDFAIGPEPYQVKSLFKQKTATETRIFVDK